ncbi:MAG: methyltransferase domain-containing protein, partial [Patescibacteria group bacterium]|nr:methyltransferase domain-containing protein [Patescibacteria group bacterium]
LEKAGINKETIFYDLGSGTGKAVILAALIYEIKKSMGIEYLESLVNASNDALSQIKKIINFNSENINFIKGDIFESDFSDGNIIFMNSTCFSDEQLKRLSELSLNLKQGSKLIVLTKKIEDNQNFQMLSEDQYSFSWGFATVRIYERI